MEIFMNRCKLVEADVNGNWEILRCPSSRAEYYVVRTLECKSEYVAEAFVRAKQKGLIDELTTIYSMDCGEGWVGTLGVFGTAWLVTVTDYNRVECMSGFMEIVKEVTNRLREVKHV